MEVILRLSSFLLTMAVAMGAEADQEMHKESSSNDTEASPVTNIVDAPKFYPVYYPVHMLPQGHQSAALHHSQNPFAPFPVHRGLRPMSPFMGSIRQPMNPMEPHHYVSSFSPHRPASEQRNYVDETSAFPLYAPTNSYDGSGYPSPGAVPGYEDIGDYPTPQY